MNVAVINYGMGNLASVCRAITDVGGTAFVAGCPAELEQADAIVLPGVGAFATGMERLSSGGWVAALHRLVAAGDTPLLGICLGMQMLATVGEEGGTTPGLGLVPGAVRRLDAVGCAMRIPHVGWNDVRQTTPSRYFDGIPDDSDFYFVHSYTFLVDSADHLLATASYGCELTAAVGSGRVMGCQFHPEKSSRAGRQLLKNFLDCATC